jgi:hypothetical protein
MERLIFISLMIFTSFITKSQYIYFNEEYNNDLNSGATGIFETDSGYIIGGWSAVEDNGEGMSKVLISTIDFEGNQLSWKTYGEHGWQYGVSQSGGFTRLSDGGYTLCGTTYNGELYGTFLMRFDQNGDSLWTRIYGDPVPIDDTLIAPYTCLELPDKGLILTGSIDNRPGGTNILLMRTDSLGNMLWLQQYGTGNWTEVGGSIALLPDGGFLVGTSRFYAPVNSYQADAGLLKTDSLGNMTWLKYYGSDFEEWIACVALGQDGNYLVSSVYAVYQENTEFPEQRAWLFKTDTAGNVLWDKTYARCNFFGFSTGIHELENGDIIASGQASYTDGFGTFGYILKTNSMGDSLWMHDYFIYPEDVNFLNDLSITNDGGMILTGLTMGPPLHTQAVWAEKLDNFGMIVGIEEQGSGGAGMLGSMEVWPNPCGEMLNVEGLMLNSGIDYELAICDIFGRTVIARQISLTPDGGRAGDVGTGVIDVSSLPPGIYIAVAKEGGKIIASRKFIISR